MFANINNNNNHTFYKCEQFRFYIQIAEFN